MASDEFTQIACPNCGNEVSIPVPGDAVCDTHGCGHMFRAFGKRDRESADQFYGQQASVRDKLITEAQDGRLVVSYYYEQVEPFIIEKLTDVIDEEPLRIVQAGLTEKLEKPMTILERRKGRFVRISPLTPRAHYERFCSFLRDVLGGEKACCEYDEERAMRLYEADSPRTLFEPCWAGLYDLSIPIMINEKVVAVFLTGQLRLEGKKGDSELLDGVQRVKKKLELSEAQTDELLKLADEAVGASRIKESGLEGRRREWEAVVDTITRLGSEKFYAQRQVSEQLFLDEIFALFDMVKDESSLWAVLDRVLRRLCEFCHFEFGTFLAAERPARPFALRSIGRVPSSGLIAGRNMKVTQGEVDFRSRKLLLLDRSNPGGALMGKMGSLLGLASVTFAVVARVSFREEGQGLILLVNRTPIGGRRRKLGISEYGRRFLEKAVHEIGIEIRTTLSNVDLRRRDRDRGEFEAATLHALRTYMQSILGKTGYLKELLRLRPDDSATIEEVIQVSHEIDACVQLLNAKARSLSYSTAVAAEAVFRCDRPVSLEALLRRCAERFRHAAAARGIRILFNKESYDLPPARMDGDKLDIAFSNIIDNAVKYSHHNKRIWIDLAFNTTKKLYLISISDFGLGILERDSEKVFQKHYRARHEDPRRFVTGTGIGLAVAKDIVEGHGGRIYYTSSRGEGHKGTKLGVEGYKTTFNIEMPSGVPPKNRRHLGRSSERR